MISVVIPLYNKERQIGRTLRTVLAQTYQDFEIVIVDDGSTDGSAAEVAVFNDPRIRLIQQQNAGVSAARNHGIEESRGEFVALLDADDEWCPDYLATQMSLVEKYPQCDVFATNYQFKDVEGQITPTIIRNLPFEEEHGLLYNYFEVASCSHPPICSNTIMARKSAFQAVGGFPVGIKSGEDLLTWARLACRFKIAYCKMPLAVFCQSLYQTKSDSKSTVRLGGEDFILNELLNLYNSADFDAEYKNGLKDYINRWYKIYCVLLIESGQCHRIFPIAMSALKFGAPKSTMLMLLCFACMPTGVAQQLFIKLRR